MGLENIEQELKELTDLLKNKEQVKEKKFRFPFGKKVGRSQRRKNFVTVLVINENGNYDFKKYQVESQSFLHDKIPRIASAGYTMFDKKGNPLIILPSWSVEPFSPLKDYKSSLTDGSNTTGYKLLMEKMQREQLSSKPKMGGALKWILGLGLVGIIIYAFLTSGGA